MNIHFLGSFFSTHKHTLKGQQRDEDAKVRLEEDQKGKSWACMHFRAGREMIKLEY